MGSSDDLRVVGRQERWEGGKEGNGSIKAGMQTVIKTGK